MTISLTAHCFAASVDVDENSESFAGQISVESVSRFESRIKDKSVKWLHITSPGGDIEASLKLGKIVHQRQLNVYVDGVCASSCANYVFPAASMKVIGPNAIIGWHGGANSQSFDGIDISSLQKDSPELVLLNKLRSLEIEFFRVINVSDRLVCAGDANVVGPDVIGWTMSIQSMRRFGLENVIAIPPKKIPLTPPGRSERLLVLNPTKTCGVLQPEEQARLY